MTKILDGKKLSEKILTSLKEEIKTFHGTPTLAVIFVGDDVASQIYVNSKRKTAEKIGIKSIVFNYPKKVSENELVAKIKELNINENVHAILVQLPLPKHINTQNIISKINPKKDVDGFTPENVGKLVIGMKPYVYPCTPKGILMLLDEYQIEIEGKHAVIVGRSNIVGKPLAQMLLNRNATVTITHSKTKNLQDIIKTADILISAVGIKNLIVGESVRECVRECERVVVIDVGINRTSDGKICGDVDFESVSKQTSFITPTPGGVGPMTIASLMSNTVELFKLA